MVDTNGWFEVHKDFFEALKINGRFTRLFKLFETKFKKYVYDLGTGKIFICSEFEYKILKSLFDNNCLHSSLFSEIDETMFKDCLDNLTQIITKENLFQAYPLTGYSSSHGDFNLTKEVISRGLEQITLELTERCNLRCKYCIYSDEYELYRNFSPNDMTWEIAHASIDYAIKHSSENLTVTFYGGEPLLQFDLLKKCVEYISTIKGTKIIIYSMTTNMTLITKEIADYLSERQMFSVICSLDGPEEINDENRISITGDGSFS